MKNKVHETIIIGAGISGLACARKLYENGKEFLVISENIGGRCGEYSKNGVPYGAMFILGNYHNFKRFAKLKRRISISQAYFHEGNQSYSILDKRILAHPLQLIRFLLLLYKFRKDYEAIKKKCESSPQAATIRSNPLAFKLYNQNANDLMHEYDIKDILEGYMAKILYGITSKPINQMNGSEIVWSALPLIYPIYDFVFLKEKMIKGFKKNILIDSVIKITKKKGFYAIKTKEKKLFYTKNVVVATPPHISQKLLHIKKIKKPVSGHLFHLSGKLQAPSKYGEYNFFEVGNPTLLILHQTDGSFLFLSKEKKPKFEDHFQEYNIIKYKFWDPACSHIGNILWECEQDKNLYLIGDHNLPDLEDAYITGLYAANQIIKGVK